MEGYYGFEAEISEATYKRLARYIRRNPTTDHDSLVESAINCMIDCLEEAEIQAGYIADEAAAEATAEHLERCLQAGGTDD